VKCAREEVLRLIQIQGLHFCRIFGLRGGRLVVLASYVVVVEPSDVVLSARWNTLDGVWV